jgi:adenosylhomocysteine nucleosidase
LRRKCKNIVSKPVVIFSALKEEVATLRKKMSDVSEEESSVTEGKLKDEEIVLAITGVGGKRAEKSAELILDKFQPKLVISTGMCGATVPELKIGDLALYTSVLHLNREGEVESRVICDKNLLSSVTDLLRERKFTFHSGDGLTSPKVVCQPEEKLNLGRKFSVKTVDMESFFVSRVAEIKSIPFLTLRSVSDEVSERLPDFDQFTKPGGGTIWRNAFFYLPPRPLETLRLFRMRNNSKRAGKILSESLNLIVEKLKG